MLLAISLSFLPLMQFASASYTVRNLNVTITLEPNTSAQVTEVLSVLISNASASQYSTDRLALNLTLSDWQQEIGPMLEQHILNPNSSAYNFKFLPGPITHNVQGQSIALMILSYDVKNVTFVNQTAPRQFTYRFNPKVFNFEHGVSGEILSSNTTLTMVIPPGAVISSAYPLPDLPVYAFTNNYANVTSVSWLYGEPLSKFSFIFVVHQGIQAEVEDFFNGIYTTLGLFTYLIIAAAVLLFIMYVYIRATK